MPEINNLQIYNQRMAAGMEDKLWFVEKVCPDVNVVVDYGCADGTLLSLIRHKYPDLILIGIDQNDEMLDLARKNVPSAIFYTVDQFKDIRFNFSNAVLVLSSVVHEIYSYDRDACATMDGLFSKGFKYVAIRDMMLSESVQKASSDPFDLVAVTDRANEVMLNDFQRIHGDIRHKRNLIHFLLKYRYIENWDREVRENYLPYSLETFLRIVIPNQYQLEHLEHYVLPYICEQVEKDFGIKLKDNTHVKLLLRKS